MVDYDSFALSERRVLRKIDAVPQSTSVQDIDQLFDALPGLDGEQKEIIIDAIESSALSSESADQQAVVDIFLGINSTSRYKTVGSVPEVSTD